MFCLGIESTAHTFGIGISSEEKILSNIKSTYKWEKGKGIIPNQAAFHHKSVKEKILEKSLKKANLSFKDIDLIAYSAGPGLPPCLIVGAEFCYNLAEKYEKEVIKVNHALAHLEIGRFTTSSKDPVFVYLSGGNTQIISKVSNSYKIFGETIDIPIGNCLDVVAREMGLEMPGGPKIEELAKKGRYLEMPYVVKGMDLSFSGILTYVKNILKKGFRKEDIAYSLQETCFSMLVEVSERALAHLDKKEILLVGGVAENKRLQQMFKVMCKERGAEFFVVDKEYAGDQGAMIAYLGLIMYKSGWHKTFEIKDKILPNWRVDEIIITWT